MCVLHVSGPTKWRRSKVLKQETITCLVDFCNATWCEKAVLKLFVAKTFDKSKEISQNIETSAQNLLTRNFQVKYLNASEKRWTSAFFASEAKLRTKSNMGTFFQESSRKVCFVEKLCIATCLNCLLQVLPNEIPEAI